MAVAYTSDLFRQFASVCGPSQPVSVKATLEAWKLSSGHCVCARAWGEGEEEKEEVRGKREKEGDRRERGREIF